MTGMFDSSIIVFLSNEKSTVPNPDYYPVQINTSTQFG